MTRIISRIEFVAREVLAHWLAVAYCFPFPPDWDWNKNRRERKTS